MEDQEFRESVIKDLSWIKAKLNNGITSRQEDHEKRIRFLERGFYVAMGGLALLQIALKYFIK